MLKVRPDDTFMVGDLIRPGMVAPASFWVLSTEDRKTLSRSKDMRFHVEWLLDKVEARKKKIHRMCASGYEMLLSCFWESTNANGGPILDTEFMRRLSEFPLELRFDVWLDLVRHKREWEEFYAKKKK